MRPEEEALGSEALEFCLIVERGPLESQAVLLCESIRRFAGRYSESKVSAISPRADWRPSRSTQEQLRALRVDYVELDLVSPVPAYGTSYRVLGLGHLSRRPGPPIMVQLDTDTIFVGEPDFRLGDASAAARPEDTVGMCSTGPGDHREAHWRAMCSVNDLALDELPWVVASVEKKRMRASYNGGLVAAHRLFFAEVERCFLAIADAQLRSNPGRLHGIRIGAGRVTAEGYSMWGTSQAAISIAATKLGGAVRELDEAYNVPLHMYDQLERPPDRPIHLHYHWLFNDAASADAILDRALPQMPAEREWIRQKLPLPWRIVEGPGVFNPKVQDGERGSPARVAAAPACSVVMAVHDDVRFLREAVDSIISQEFADWELIVVDDGSADPEPVAALAGLDPRIRTLRSPINVGLSDALNLGIAQAQAPIIARLDADDLAERQRLGLLVRELQADPELGLVGSAVTLIDERGKVIRHQPVPETDFAIRWTMLFHCPFYHSAVAFRRNLFDQVGGYRPGMRVSEDHYLWFDMLPHARARNLAAPLCRYRINTSGISATLAGPKPRERTDPLRRELWREIGIVFPLTDEHLGRDATELLRGMRIDDRRRRASACEVIDASLERVMAISQDFLRDCEIAQVEQWHQAIRELLATTTPRPTLPQRVATALRERGPRGFCEALVQRLRDRLVPLRSW